MSADHPEVGAGNPETWIEPPPGTEEAREQLRGKANGGTTTTEPEWPAPLGLAAFHGIAGEFAAMLMPETEADPAALLFQFLTMFGNVIGDGLHYRVESTRHPARIFPVLVGKTAKGRKGTSFDRVVDLFAQVDPDWVLHRIKSGLASGEGLIHAVRDSREEWDKKEQRMLIVDEGVDDKRFVGVATEFAALLKIMARPSNTLSPLIRQSWDNGNLQNLTKNSPEKATGAHIAVIGHITADELRRHLEETEYANGFANRFLFIAVERVRLLPFGGKRIAWHDLADRLRQKIAIVREWGEAEITFDDDASRLWEHAYRRLSDGRPGLFGAVTARAEAQVPRLALIYATLDAAQSIGVPHLKAALECWRYAEQSARFIFGDALGDPIADTILAALRQQPDGMTRTDIRDVFARNAKSADVERALLLLLREGRATRTSERTDGRPAERWRAAPR